MRPAASSRIVIAIALIGQPGLPARAQDASEWQADAHAAARLIAGATLKSDAAARLRAGIEIRLDPGWKTYWRYPGDSGMPPTLDFRGSENVRSVAVLWPAPQRFPDGAGGHSIGYHGDVVLPLRIIPQDTTRPSSLFVKLGYAICANLCVPVEADLNLVLSGEVDAEAPTLVAAEERVPRRVALGAGTGLAIRSVHREPGREHERVVVDVAAPEGTPIDLFVEGPTPSWALPLPEQTGPAPGGAPERRRFSFDLDGMPPGARAAGATLTFTAVSPHDAIEVSARLD